jgi:hypothetical protein
MKYSISTRKNFDNNSIIDKPGSRLPFSYREIAIAVVPTSSASARSEKPLSSRIRRNLSPEK